MYRIKQIILFLGDWVMLYLGFLIALMIRNFSSYGEQFNDLFLSMLILFFSATVIFFVIGLYDLYQIKNGFKFFKKIFISAFCWFVLGILFFYLRREITAAPKTILVLVTAISFILVALWRYLYNRYLSTHIFKINIIFTSYTPEVKDLIKILRNEPERGYHLSGIITQDQWIDDLDKELLIGKSIADIRAKGCNGPTSVVLTDNLDENQQLLKELYQNLFKDISVTNIDSFYEEITGRIAPFSFSENYFISNLQEQHKKIYDRFKLVIDYILASLLAIFFIITFPFIALSIKISSRGPLFFHQDRVGRNGNTFRVYKYRTMKALASDGSAEINGPQFTQSQDSRITVVGKLLRKTRLDEIPQLINIFKREMSFIGPRPERPEYVKELLETMPYYSLRHLIKPGLTGWAQVKHGYTANMGENLKKLEYDLYYIKNRGPLLDISIILRTINTVIRMAGK